MDQGTSGVGSSRSVDVALCALLVLLVSVPTLAVEEDWHGTPMIDQATHLWLLAVLLVVGAFFVGGMIAAFRRPAAPVRYAAAAALLAVAVLLAGAVSRRAWLAHEGVSGTIRGLWCVAAVAAVAISVVGSLVGRRIIERTFRGHHVRRSARWPS